MGAIDAIQLLHKKQEKITNLVNMKKMNYFVTI